MDGDDKKIDFQDKYANFAIIEEEDGGEEPAESEEFISEYHTKLKCGEIILVQDEWKILFRCDACGLESPNLDYFLMHSLEHYLSVSAESIDELLKQPAVANEADPKTFPTAVENLDSNSNDDTDKCASLNAEETEEDVPQHSDAELGDGIHNAGTSNAVDELCIEVLDKSESVNCQPENTDLEDALSSEEDNYKTYERIKAKQPVKTATGVTIFTCDICAKRFRWRERFELHMRRHNGIKPFVCEFCNASFADTSNFNTHRKRHLGIKPHVCDICSKSFTATTDLTRHRRSHTGERPYRCTECDKCFKTTAMLNVHRRRHTNTRPYICATCGKGFYEGYHLRDHEVSHKNDRPYACEDCDAKFSRHKALVQHMKLHSGVKEYSCDVCGKEFAQKAGIISHVKIHQRE